MFLYIFQIGSFSSPLMGGKYITPGHQLPFTLISWPFKPKTKKLNMIKGEIEKATKSQHMIEQTATSDQILGK